MSPRAGEIAPNDDARSRLSELILSTKERFTVLRTSHNLSTGEILDPAITYSEFHDGLIALRTDSLPPKSEFLISLQHPRNSFDERNFSRNVIFDRAESLKIMEGSWSFDGGDEQLALQNQANKSFNSSRGSANIEDRTGVSSWTAQTGSGQPEEPSHWPKTLTSSDLKSFIENPPRSYLRWSLGITLADLSEESSDSLDGEFTNYLKSKTIGAIFQSATSQSFTDDETFIRSALRSMETSGDLPSPPMLPVDDITDDVGQFLKVWERCTKSAIQRVVPVDLRFGDSRLIDHIDTFEIGGKFHVVEVITSKLEFHKLIHPWIRALAVEASLPVGTEVGLIIICRPSAKTGQVLPPVREKYLPSTAESAGEAQGTLDALADLFRQNLTNPLLFNPKKIKIENEEGKFSLKAPPVSDEDWSGASYSGSPSTSYLKDRSWRAVFSHLTAGDLAPKGEMGAKYISTCLEMGKLFGSPFNLFSVELKE
jgi:exonuclease V gamma subunit